MSGLCKNLGIILRKTKLTLITDSLLLPELRKLADTFQTELTVLGHSDDTGILKVWHKGELVCCLDNSKLHDAPIKKLESVFTPGKALTGQPLPDKDLNKSLETVMGDFAIVSREPIIREYDHEGQGNTILKPLAGAQADAPQDGVKRIPTPWVPVPWTNACANSSW